MATRRDQLQSYQFLLQRVVSALVYRKTDPAQSPFRKAGGAVFAGVMISILALAVTAVIGLFAKGFGKSVEWTHGGAVIIEEDTGAQYVVYPTDDEKDKLGIEQRLYPLLNYTSGVLLAGSADPIMVDRNDLSGEDVPARGMTIGIPGAPDTLPAKDDLLTGGWSICSLNKKTTAGDVEPVSYAYVGTHPKGGTKLSKKQALYVASSDSKKEFLIWNSHKFDITDNNTARSALALTGGDPSPVEEAFVNAIPDGAAIKVPSVTDPGGASAVPDIKNGQVLQVGKGADADYFVAQPDGAAAITEVQAKLLLADEELAKEVGSEPVSQSTAPTKIIDGLKPDDQAVTSPPPSVPELTSVGDMDTAGCALYGKDGEIDKIMTGTKINKDAGVSTQQVSEDGTALADRVVVTGGKGALVAVGGPKAESGAYQLVTDTGLSYPLGSQELIGIFGYDHGQVTKVYAGLFSMVPVGLAPGVALSVKDAQANAFNSK